MSGSLLPDRFGELEPFASAWSLATEWERRAQRASSTMEEIRAFYTAMLAKMEEVLEYLNRFPLDGMPEEARRLFNMTLSLAEIAPAVEFYGQPEVADGFPAARFVPLI